MSQYKKHGVVLSVFIILISILAFYVFHEEKMEIKDEKKEVILTYLLHDNTLVEHPFNTYAHTVEDKVKEIIKFMGKSENGFTPLLYENTVLEKVEQTDNMICISFSMLDYPLNLERKVLESLIYSCTQFEKIENVQIKLQDHILTMMPKGGLSLKDTSRNFGINAFESNDIYLHKGIMDVIYFCKKIDNKTYFVPKSVRIKEDSYEEKILLLCETPSIYNKLFQPFYKKQIKSTKSPVFEDGILHVYFDSSILNNTKKLDSTCVEVLKRTFKEDIAIEVIQIHVDEKVYSINLSNS